jgi:hypothetical protein
MALRTLKDPLPMPPKGTVVIAVGRHLTPVYPDPKMLAFHKARAEAIHDLVDACGLKVRSWGATDDEFPREIVEIIVPIASAAIGSVATVLAAWVSTRGSRRKQMRPADTPVLGFAMQAPDGSRVEFTYRDGADFERVVAAVSQIAEAARPPATKKAPAAGN